MMHWIFSMRVRSRANEIHAGYLLAIVAPGLSAEKPYHEKPSSAKPNIVLIMDTTPGPPVVASFRSAVGEGRSRK